RARHHVGWDEDPEAKELLHPSVWKCIASLQRSWIPGRQTGLKAVSWSESGYFPIGGPNAEVRTPASPLFHQCIAARCLPEPRLPDISGFPPWRRTSREYQNK